MDATPEFTLRPLGIGEIFDRAVTLYVRNFAAFTLIVLTLLIPLAILQYIILPDQAAALSHAVGHASTGSKRAPFPFSSKQIAGFVVLIAVAMAGAAFTNNAVAVGVARLYQGAKPAYGPCYATVFRRWAPLLATAIMNACILFGAYLASSFGVIVVATIGVAIAASALPVSVVLFIFAGILGLAAFALFLMLVMAYVFAMYSTSLEDVSATRAIALAYRRLFNKSEIKKAFLMTLAYVGLQIGVVTLSSVVGLLMMSFVKSYALQLAVNAVVSAMLAAFLAILLAVYYYDVRTRAEGLDLESDLERLTASPA